MQKYGTEIIEFLLMVIRDILSQKEIDESVAEMLIPVLQCAHEFANVRASGAFPSL